MGQAEWCLVAFLTTYTLNLVYITVFYHRGLTHSALELKPWLKTFVALTGNWITGLDPKGWACMHRLHHRHADTEDDPHSPHNGGIWRVFVTQLHSYRRALIGLLKHDPVTEAVVKDLDFPVHWLNRHKLWWAPYLLHFAIAGVLWALIGSPWIAAAYWLGLMSHPIQGWMVNALAHAFGYRNFDTPDRSTNNTLVAWFVFGEGFQNNHHRHPTSAKFSVKWFEVDWGYGLCVLLHLLGMIELRPVREPVAQDLSLQR